ncbi:hypothetical protein [Streptomyces sp. cmx-4-9]|uniref:hypothetical protein n=1 Tax=Streptomyces sp. cmx-4-9 TaxID=2790941 RepID=UPI003980973B
MDYDSWNTAFTDHFFAVRDHPVPIYLAVDDARLAELHGQQAVAPSSATPSDDFHAAIRSVVYGRNPFQKVAARTRLWRREGGSDRPPFIALLAATVLAASRMSRTDGTQIGRFSYYQPLRQILGIDGAAGMPDGYDEVVPSLWNQLEWWLVEHEGGRRGLPSAIAHPTQVYIGKSLSQAVLLGSDRAQVGQFFSVIGLRPGDTMPKAELLARFEEWSRSFARVSPRIVRALEALPLRAVLADILHQELKHYDGLARDSVGTPCLSLSLTSTDGGAPYGLAVRIPAGFAATSIDLPDAPLVLPPGHEWAPVVTSALEAGPGLSGHLPVGTLKLMLTGKDCYVLQANDLVGRWTSVNAAEIGVPHRVLVRNPYAAQAEEVMRSCGAEPTKLTRRVQVPAGWTLFTRYVPTRSASAPGCLGALSPLHRQLARLVGGLRMEGGRHTFLVGHAPDLMLPAAPDGRPQTVTLDGQRLPLAESADTITVRLAGLPLVAGEHRVAVGEHRLTFTLVQRFRETTAPVVLALRSKDARISMVASRVAQPFGNAPSEWDQTSGLLAGATLSGSERDSLPPMTPLRLGDAVYAMGRDRTAALLISETPAWLPSTVPPARHADLEALLAALSFQAVWLLRVKPSGSRSVSRAPAVLEGRYGKPSGSWKLLDRADWHRLVGDGPVAVTPDACRADWSRYAFGGRQ